MSNDSLVLIVCFLVSLLHVEHTVSSVKLENLTNVVSLTVKNFDENIAEKHHFVLFYVKRLVLSNSDNVSPLINGILQYFDFGMSYFSYFCCSCPRCDELSSVMKKLAEKFKTMEDEDIVIAKADCTIEKNLCRGRYIM